MNISPKGKVDLSGLRVPYEPENIQEDFFVKNPFTLFDIWWKAAQKMSCIREPNAMAIASADKSGKPSVRYVLLKGYSTDGFIFFTNYNSRKGKEIIENPQVALLFYWESLYRQIRIEGRVEKLSTEESEEYFHSRPRSSQISAVVSHQSEVIESKQILVKKVQELNEIYSNEAIVIPKPSDWGGFVVKPDSFEFWGGQSDRLHDRMRFRRPKADEVPDGTLSHAAEDGWIYEYLSP